MQQRYRTHGFDQEGQADQRRDGEISYKPMNQNGEEQDRLEEIKYAKRNSIK